jgi:Asp-tRNA(Asn)/Glu-tRNA(Gln) amidotransferase C subunit
MADHSAPDKLLMKFDDLHAEHVQWLSILDLAKDELAILQHRLEEIVQRNNKADVMAKVEHFQNLFIRQHEVIDELRHAVNEHEQFLRKEARERPETITHRRFGDHAVLRDQFVTFEQLFKEMREDFQPWLAKVL